MAGDDFEIHILDISVLNPATRHPCQCQVWERQILTSIHDIFRSSEPICLNNLCSISRNAMYLFQKEMWKIRNGKQCVEAVLRSFLDLQEDNHFPSAVLVHRK